MPRLLLWLISGDAPLAHIAPGAGIDRILVDLERLGKAERQRNRGLFLSDHDWTDVMVLRRSLPSGMLFVRLDPLHDSSRDQVERALACGADGLMLPFFHDSATVLRFVELVKGRAIVTPLVETAEAVRQLPLLLRSGAISEFHVGLNDLAIDLSLESLQQLWGHPLLDEIADVAGTAGIPFGIGGVTDPRIGGLPIDARYVIAEQRRLRSTRALLGRSFKAAFGDAPDLAAVRASVDAIRQAYRNPVIPQMSALSP